MTRPVRGTAAGRAYLDLQNRARREKRATQDLLTMYVVERWLARLSRSTYASDFILKGGMLLASFGHRRPTVDADALARNMPSDQQLVARHVAEITSLPDANDGVEFLQVELRPLAGAVSDLGVLRASTYRAYRRTLGECGHLLPEEFQDVVDAAGAFVDPTLGELGDGAVWDPTRRRW